MKMPTRARESLAVRFRQNWMAKYPVDVPSNGAAPLDDSLTSLNWLQNLNIMKTLSPTPPASPEPLDAPHGGGGSASLADLFKQRPGDGRVNPNAILNVKTTGAPPRGACVKQEPSLGGAYSTGSNNHVFRSLGTVSVHHYSNQHSNSNRSEVAPPLATNFNPYHERIDYRTNSSVKPPYSYATLICMAMRETRRNKITLAGIYNWITENFIYYRVADPSWQNSIRHNLSLNKCFQKVARRKDEPGKGGFWRINPEYSDMFVNGVFKKRRTGGVSRDPQMYSPMKRIKLEPRDSEDQDPDETYLAAMAISGDLSSSASPPPASPPPHHGPASGGVTDPDIHGLHESLSDHRGLVKSDFNWNAIFHQDIEVSGMRIKTEDIIDNDDDGDGDTHTHGGDSCDSDAHPLGVTAGRGLESPITALSPPASDTNSDIALDDFLNPPPPSAAFPGGVASGVVPDLADCPLDLSTGGDLDLTITGHSLKAPDWWSETLLSSSRGSTTGSGLMPPSPHHGLHTPVAHSPAGSEPSTQEVHPWAEQRSLDEAIASFDLDLQNLFEDDL